MPLTLFNELTSSVTITFSSSSGLREDRIILAVDAPTPETDSNKIKHSLSFLSKNPNKVWESSLTER